MPTKTGATLKLTPSEFIPYSFTFFIKHKGEDVDMIGSTVRLADSEGAIWAGESLWTVDELIDPIGSLGSLSWPVPAADAGKEASALFESSSFFSGARTLMDDRFYHHLVLGSTLYTVQMKYQAPVLDLAFYHDAELTMTHLYARVSEFYGYEGHAANEDDDEENEPDTITIPPFFSQVNFDDRLFLDYYTQMDDDEWERDTIPRWVTFEKTGESGPKNPFVTVEGA